MSLLKLSKKPKWRHIDAEIRLAAIKNLGEGQTDILTELACNDGDKRVRLAAVEAIHDPTTLAGIRDKTTDQELAERCRNKINLLLLESIITTDDPDHGRLLLVKVDDEMMLAEAAARAANPQIRICAVELINQPEALYRIVTCECGKLTAKAAIDKIDDESWLQKIAESGASKSSRAYAQIKLTALRQSAIQPSAKEIVAQQLRALLADAVKLKDSINWQLAEERLATLKGMWRNLDPELRHPLAATFIADFDHFQARKNQYEQERAEEEIKAAAYNALVDQCSALVAEIEQLIGSLDPGADELFRQATAKWQLISSALVRETSAALFHRYDKSQEDFQQATAIVREETALLNQLHEECMVVEKDCLANLDIAELELKKFQQKISRLHCRYQSLPGLDLKISQIKSAVDAAREAIALALEKSRQETVQKRQAICAGMAALVEEIGNRSDAEKKYKALKDSWTCLDTFNDQESRNLASHYQELVEIFHTRQREFYNVQEWQQWANKSLKEELCLKIEFLNQEENLQLVAAGVKEAQARWKKIGPGPRNTEKKLWKRFHKACEFNFERCQPFFQAQEEIREENLRQKELLCGELEALCQTENFKASTAKLKSLQEKWAACCDGPREKDREIIARYRRACNRFYELRRKHLEESDQQHQEHLIQKERICQEVEEYANNPERLHNQKIKNLQKQWQTIGPGPRQKEDEIWQRFRQACDRYYNWLKEQHLENLRQKEALCRELETVLAQETPPMMDSISRQVLELQKKWQAIGAAPHKQQEQIWQRFKKLCDDFFQRRRDLLQQRDQERQAKLQLKQGLLQRAEEIIQLDDHQMAANELQELQKTWLETGSDSGDEERTLDRRFLEICNGYFKERRQFLKEMHRIHNENLKKKEALCFQLEKITGISFVPTETSERDAALSLADRFRIARESNFVLAGKTGNRQLVKEEINRIQEEWGEIGPLPINQEKLLLRRYQYALDQHYHKADNSSGSKKN